MVSRLFLAILLKCCQYMGRPVKISEVSTSIKKHIANQVEIALDTDLSNYPTTTFKNHKKVVREYLDINLDKQKRRQVMKQAALESAATKENLADIINRVIEEIFHQGFEIPGYRALVGLSRAVRAVINNQNYKKISDSLSNEQKNFIDTILSIEDDHTKKEWTWFEIKQEPKSPTAYNMRNFILYVQRLKELREKLFVNVDFISPARLEHLRDEVMITDQSDMRKIADLKRYALVVILVYMKVTTAIDDLVHVLTVWMRQIENKAKEKYQNYQLEQAEKTNALILSLYNMLLILERKDAPKNKIAEIENQFGNKISELIEACREHLGLTGDKYFGWMLTPYNNKRALIFNLLEHLNIFSSSEDKSIEKEYFSLKTIAHHTKNGLNLMLMIQFKLI